MVVRFVDFNSADNIIDQQFASQWSDVHDVLAAMPLHVKSSDQAGIQGSPIFDPVGTNEHIKAGLIHRDWSPCIPIPRENSFLGTNIDFGKDGVIVEAQFSNYPFLLNNALRSELFFRSHHPLSGRPTGLLILITKAHMFPSSNSTLYYEHAENQLSALVSNHIIGIPIRLVGLFEHEGTTIMATFTEYESARYSRAVAIRTNRQCMIRSGRGAKSRCIFDFD
jgi:hypothetical protein